MSYFNLHKIQFTACTDGGFDGNGVPLPDTEQTEDLPCHIDRNSRGETHYRDGVAYNFSYHIFIDPSGRAFRVGEKVRLFGLYGEELEGDKRFEVIDFFRYPSHVELWV